MLRLSLILLFLLSTFFFVRPAGNKSAPPDLGPPFENAGKAWVDSIMKKLTPEQRMGQLFMVAAYSNKDKAHQDEITKIVRDPNHAYNNPNATDREHQAAIDYVNSLYAAINRGGR
jgi:hypothetical protein